MQKVNEMNIEFSAVAENEGFARIAAGAFMLPMNPTVEEVEDVKTAVSEAVTNAIIHGYRNCGGVISMHAAIFDDHVLQIEIKDSGIGIHDVEKAMEPLYTTCPDMERSGMGFTVMKTFMDSLTVLSDVGMGTTVRMTKKIRKTVQE